MPTPVPPALLEGRRDFLRFLERRVGDRALAEDLLQEAFVRGVTHAAELRDAESAVAWFWRTLRNVVIDHHRRAGASARALDALAAELEREVDPGPDAQDAVCRCVTRVADALRPEYAEAIRRVDVDGAAVKSWAAEAGITPNAASVRLHRARAALRDGVRSACGACAEHGCLDCTCGDGTAPPRGA